MTSHFPRGAPQILGPHRAAPGQGEGDSSRSGQKSNRTGHGTQRVRGAKQVGRQEAAPGCLETCPEVAGPLQRAPPPRGQLAPGREGGSPHLATRYSVCPNGDVRSGQGCCHHGLRAARGSAMCAERPGRLGGARRGWRVRGTTSPPSPRARPGHRTIRECALPTHPAAGQGSREGETESPEALPARGCSEAGARGAPNPRSWAPGLLGPSG